MAMTMNPPVFLISGFLIILVVALGIGFTDTFEVVVEHVNDFINTYFGWFYILSVSIFVVFVLVLMTSKYGKIRLSSDDSPPSYSYFSWLAMLFSAGMGIGLLFYGVAEPIKHFTEPPIGSGETIEAAKTAMNISFLHWGLHAWATYIVIGLAIAYFSYRKGYPLSIRFIFYPLFGKRIYGWVGHTIDILAILGTLFGVATSLGLGAMQINTGLSYLTNIPDTLFVKYILITCITLMAMTSVVSGVNKGIKWLSIFNISVGAFLLLFVIFFGPTLYIFKAIIQHTGHFMQEFISTSLWTGTFRGSEWQSDWTVFYWSWWISWSPYVGMFIARISKGRTIREFISGVLFIPSFFSFIWLTAFGSTGIRMTLLGDSTLMNAVDANITTALFVFLDQFPFSVLVSFIATAVIITFFVTSSDSGSLVIDMISSGGSTDPPVWQRIFWSLLEGTVAATLLAGGGLLALQTAAISMALPFSLVLLLICFSLYRGLRSEATAQANG